MGLVEIAANAGRAVDQASFKEMEDTLVAYDAAMDKKAFVDRLPPAAALNLSHRYNEWLALRSLLRNVDLEGKKVLDVGAGVGGDSYRLLRAGAQVTALEYSPVLAREGRKALPEIRWIGGFSHAIPFASGSFDYVFCNAALHHMRDVPAAIAEMLRVLRPGGLLITSGDSYRANNTPQALELSVFNDHPFVLLGVNEQMPRLENFLSPLVASRDHVDVEVITSSIFGLARRCARSGDANGLRRWTLDEAIECLGRTSGALSLKIKLRTAIDVRPRRLGTFILSAGEFAGWLDNQSDAMASLARLMPERYVDRRFPGKADKFDLLNGWQAPRLGVTWRQAYKRARWYLRRHPKMNNLAIDVFAPVRPNNALVELAILVNGQQFAKRSFSRGVWTSFSVDIKPIAEGSVFSVEMQFFSEGEDFDDKVFRVRRHDALWRHISRWIIAVFDWRPNRRSLPFRLWNKAWSLIR